MSVNIMNTLLPPKRIFSKKRGKKKIEEEKIRKKNRKKRMHLLLSLLQPLPSSTVAEAHIACSESAGRSRRFLSYR